MKRSASVDNAAGKASNKKKGKAATSTTQAGVAGLPLNAQLSMNVPPLGSPSGVMSKSASMMQVRSQSELNMAMSVGGRKFGSEERRSSNNMLVPNPTMQIMPHALGGVPVGMPQPINAAGLMQMSPPQASPTTKAARAAEQKRIAAMAVSAMQNPSMKQNVLNENGAMQAQMQMQMPINGKGSASQGRMMQPNLAVPGGIPNMAGSGPMMAASNVQNVQGAPHAGMAMMNGNNHAAMVANGGHGGQLTPMGPPGSSSAAAAAAALNRQMKMPMMMTSSTLFVENVSLMSNMKQTVLTRRMFGEETQRLMHAFGENRFGLRDVLDIMEDAVRDFVKKAVLLAIKQSVERQSYIETSSKSEPTSNGHEVPAPPNDKYILSIEMIQNLFVKDPRAMHRVNEAIATAAMELTNANNPSFAATAMSQPSVDPNSGKPSPVNRNLGMPQPSGSNVAVKPGMPIGPGGGNPSSNPSAAGGQPPLPPNVRGMMPPGGAPVTGAVGQPGRLPIQIHPMLVDVGIALQKYRRARPSARPWEFIRGLADVEDIPMDLSMFQATTKTKPKPGGDQAQEKEVVAPMEIDTSGMEETKVEADGGKEPPSKEEGILRDKLIHQGLGTEPNDSASESISLKAGDGAKPNSASGPSGAPLVISKVSIGSEVHGSTPQVPSDSPITQPVVSVKEQPKDESEEKDKGKDSGSDESADSSSESEASKQAGDRKESKNNKKAPENMDKGKATPSKADSDSSSDLDKDMSGDEDIAGSKDSRPKETVKEEPKPVETVEVEGLRSSSRSSEETEAKDKPVPLPAVKAEAAQVLPPDQEKVPAKEQLPVPMTKAVGADGPRVPQAVQPKPVLAVKLEVQLSNNQGTGEKDKINNPSAGPPLETGSKAGDSGQASNQGPMVRPGSGTASSCAPGSLVARDRKMEFAISPQDDLTLHCIWRFQNLMKRTMSRQQYNELFESRTVTFVRDPGLRPRNSPRLLLFREWLDLNGGKDKLVGSPQPFNVEIDNPTLYALGHVAWEALGLITQTALLVKYFDDLDKGLGDPRAHEWSYGRHVIAALRHGMSFAILVPLSDQDLLHIKEELDSFDSLNLVSQSASRLKGFGGSQSNLLRPWHVIEALRQISQYHSRRYGCAPSALHSIFSQNCT